MLGTGGVDVEVAVAVRADDAEQEAGEVLAERGTGGVIEGAAGVGVIKDKTAGGVTEAVRAFALLPHVDASFEGVFASDLGQG